ncbi:hypothetical protein [Flagellimonas sp. C4]|uniref:hypothetical protein n=1 Tax=Flagellimonas alginolytica TaxID=3177515 RepID=UPI0035C8B86E
MNSSKHPILTKVRIATLRFISPSFKTFENQYKTIKDNPEAFFRDGEREFSKKERAYLKLIRGY